VGERLSFDRELVSLSSSTSVRREEQNNWWISSQVKIDTTISTARSEKGSKIWKSHLSSELNFYLTLQYNKTESSLHRLQYNIPESSLSLAPSLEMWAWDRNRFQLSERWAWNGPRWLSSSRRSSLEMTSPSVPPLSGENSGTEFSRESKQSRFACEGTSK